MGSSLSSFLGNVGKKKAILTYAVLFAKNNLPRLICTMASNVVLNTINKFERGISAKGTVRPGKGFTLFILIWMILLLIDGVTETLNHEVKKQEGEFLVAALAPLTASLVQPLISSVIKKYL